MQDMSIVLGKRWPLPLVINSASGHVKRVLTFLETTAALACLALDSAAFLRFFRSDSGTGTFFWLEGQQKRDLEQIFGSSQFL